MSNKRSSNIVSNDPPLSWLTSITFNGSHFVCLDASIGELIILDRELNIVSKLEINRNYTSICYVSTSNSYWAIANRSASVLYQLDRDFNEIKQIKIKNGNQSEATAIKYNSWEQSMWVTFSKRVASIEKGDNRLRNIVKVSDTSKNLAVLALADSTLISYHKRSEEIFGMEHYLGYTDLLGEIPQDQYIVDMCLVSNRRNPNEDSDSYLLGFLLYNISTSEISVMKSYLTLFAFHTPQFNCEQPKVIVNITQSESDQHLVESNMYSNSLEMSASADDIDDFYDQDVHTDDIDDFYDQDAHTDDIDDFYDQDAHTDDIEDSYDQESHTDDIEDSYDQESHTDDIEDSYDQDAHTDDIDLSYEQNAHTHDINSNYNYSGCDIDENHHCNQSYDHPKICCHCNGKCEIIQSIALEEAAIAHILNAEGEKIKTAVANFGSIDDLLRVNESVIQTIIHLTQLETQLLLKLEAICRNDCNRNQCCRECSCTSYCTCDINP